MPPPNNSVSLNFSGEWRWETFRVFNANAFPEAWADSVGTCSTRMALCLFYENELRTNLTNARVEFLELLKKNQEDMGRGLVSRPSDVPIIAYLDGIRYLGALYGFVNAVKSFLDVYAGLMGRLIDPNLRWTFKRGKVEGNNLAGGSMIKWLQNSSPKSFQQAKRLAELTREQSAAWMTELIRYRDDLSHYNDLDGFVHMNVPLREETPCFQENEISGPNMPNGETVEAYCNTSLNRLAAYVRETVVLLPSVDHTKIRVEHFLAFKGS